MTDDLQVEVDRLKSELEAVKQAERERILTENIELRRQVDHYRSEALRVADVGRQIEAERQKLAARLDQLELENAIGRRLASKQSR
jgi:hypothetical protein